MTDRRKPDNTTVIPGRLEEPSPEPMNTDEAI